MATLAKSDPQCVQSQLAPDEAAGKLLGIVEGYFDDIGLSETERDERYARARDFVDSKVAVPSRA
jgi:hypothetical protein